MNLYIIGLLFTKTGDIQYEEKVSAEGERLMLRCTKLKMNGKERPVSNLILHECIYYIDVSVGSSMVFRREGEGGVFKTSSVLRVKVRFRQTDRQTDRHFYCLQLRLIT